MRYLLIIGFFMLSQSAMAATSFDVLNQVNLYRFHQKLPALIMKREISEEASQHSIEMANHTVAFGHAGFKERVYELRKQFNFNRAAENVLYANKKSNSHELVNLWIQSPPHRLNMIGDYNLTGVGIAYDKLGGMYITQIFIKD